MRARAYLTPADLKALQHLMHVALRGCHASMKCPRCGEDVVRLLGTLSPEVLLECPECGEVWKKEVPNHA